MMSGPLQTTPAQASWEVRVRGPLGPTVRAAFPALQVRAEGSEAVLCGGSICDQSSLHGVLRNIEALGLELLEVRRGVSVAP